MSGRTAGVVAATLALLAALFAALAVRPPLAAAGDDPFFRQRGDAQKGAIIFTAAGCASCHATGAGGDEEPDPRRLGGGLVIKTRFGSFVAPNISSDRADGIGAWTDVEVANAFLAGVGRDGSQLYPALPYTSYARMRREDARDLIAYLRTLPAVPGRSRPSKLRFPFSLRPALVVWKALFFHPRPIRAASSRSASWNRGRYIATALAHCAECHSPRDSLGAILGAQRYAGGPDPSGDGWIPNITPGRDGLKGWSKDDMVQLLTQGVTPDNDEVNAPMTDVVQNFARLPRADVDAVADFILSLPPRAGPPRPKKGS